VLVKKLIEAQVEIENEVKKSMFCTEVNFAEVEDGDFITNRVNKNA
jgi:hypothetical protein